jgi:hypothetical protein
MNIGDKLYINNDGLFRNALVQVMAIIKITERLTFVEVITCKNTHGFSAGAKLLVKENELGVHCLDSDTLYLYQDIPIRLFNPSLTKEK